MSAFPSGYTTLLDIAKANGSDQVTGLIDETTKATPEVRMGSSRTIKGTSFKTWVRTALPGTAFRNANQGANVTKGLYENRLVETFIFNPRWEADVAVADRYEFGAAAYINYESTGMVEASMQQMGRQFFYGRNTYQVGGLGPDGTSGTYFGGDIKGFPGLIDGYNTLYEKDAGGTTPNTASDVWGVKFGNQNVNWIWGNGGSMTMEPLTKQRVLDNFGKPFTAYCSEMLAYPGLQIGDQRSIVRIKNITTDAGHMLTDQLLYDAQAQLPAAVKIDMWFMSQRSLAQLRDSRTTYNPLGTPAPIPTDGGGIPIYVTDSIQNNQPLNLIGVTPIL